MIRQLSFVSRFVAGVGESNLVVHIEYLVKHDGGNASRNCITGPDEALKYAQGQTIKHPLGYDINVETPMDFMGMTDHSDTSA